MNRWRERIAFGYWGLTLVLLGVGAAMAVRAPLDPMTGPIQKLVYLHLPVAANTFLSALVVCVASVGYIGGRRRMWDDLAHAAAAVTVLNGTVLLMTGMFWGKVAWGMWWTWSPRLTFSLVLWLLYVVYLAIRFRVHSHAQRAVISSIYGVVAFLDVPLLYMSVKLLPDVHPTGAGLTADMYPTLWVWFGGISMLTAGMIVSRFTLSRMVGFRWHADEGTPHSFAGASR